MAQIRWSATCCNESVVPQQALALANSQLSQQQAGVLAPRLAAGDAFIDDAFATILGRPASPDERRLAASFLDRTADQAKARTNLVHALFNHNDFVTIR